MYVSDTHNEDAVLIIHSEQPQLRSNDVDEVRGGGGEGRGIGDRRHNKGTDPYRQTKSGALIRTI